DRARDLVADGVVDPRDAAARRPGPAGRADPSRPIVHAGIGRLRGGQVGVDVLDAVDVAVVNELTRADETPRQPAIDGDVRAPGLRELEVRHRDVELVARGVPPVRYGLVEVGVRVERPRRHVVVLDEAGDDAVVADLVRDPHVGGLAREDARAAANLRALIV